MKLPKRLFKWIGVIIAVPVGLFFLTAILLYLPPVQTLIKNVVTDSLSKEMNMDVSIGRVRLAFPIDFVLDDALAMSGRDTVVAAEHVRLDVRLLPLLKAKAEVEALELWKAKMDTKSLISDTRIVGSIGQMGVVRPAVVDLKAQQVDVNRFMMRNSDVKVFLSDTAAVDTSTSAPTPWKIRLKLVDFKDTRLFLRMPGDSMRISANLPGLRLDEGSFDLGSNDYRIQTLSLHNSDVTYDVPQAMSAQGFDANHIALGGLTLRLDTLRYAADRLTMAVRRLMVKEKCGLEVRGMNASVAYDPTGVEIPRLCLRTGNSRLSARARLPWNALKSGQKEQLDVTAQGTIGKGDLMLFMPSEMKSMAEVPMAKGLEIDIDAQGNMDDLNVRKAALQMPPFLEMDINGTLQALVNEENRTGGLHYTIKTGKGLPLNAFLPKDVAEIVNVPGSMSLKGTADVKGDRYMADALLSVGTGRLAVKGAYTLKSEAYKATITAQQFPLNVFLPKDSLSALTAKITADGRGFDFFSDKTRLSAKADIEHFQYAGMPLDSMVLDAVIKNGDMKGHFTSDNRMLQANLDLSGNVSNKVLSASVKGGIEDLFLHYLGGSNDTTHVGADLNVNAYVSKDGTRMGTDGSIDQIRMVTPSQGFTAMYALNFDFDTSSDSTSAHIFAGDLDTRMNIDKSVADIADVMGNIVDTVMTQVQNGDIDQRKISEMMPNMNFSMVGGKSNPLYNTMSFMGYGIDSLNVRLRSVQSHGLDGKMEVFALKTGGLLLDVTTARLFQDSTGLQLKCDIANRSKRNPNKFDAHLNGRLFNDGGSVETVFLDEKNKEGLNLGVRAQIAKEGTLTVRLFPEVSTIAYRKFKINKDNYFTISKDKCVSADVNLLADDRTGLKIETPEGDSIREMTVSLSNLNLDELTHVLPFLPRLGGLLGGDVHAKWDDQSISAAGTINADGFKYEDALLGNISTELLYLPNSETEHYVVANLSRDDKEIMNIEGTYLTDGSDSLLAEANLTQFPSDMLNGFMGEDGTLALSGVLNGGVDISGTLADMHMNGKLTPDSLCVLSPAYGMNMRVEDKTLFIKDSKIVMDDIKMYAEKQNPLTVNGNVDLGDLSNVRMDLGFKARNFQVVNSQRTKQSVVFGNVFADIDATVKGTTSLLMVKGDLKVLDNTNVTYIMKDSPLTVEDQLNGLVEFVDFSDSAAVEKEDLQALSGVFVNMNVRVSDATKLHCELSADGKSYFTCEGGGNLNMLYFPTGEISLTGRYAMNSGEMKYALPFIPLKTFKLNEGSYISFSGDPANPALNITAMETMRASVNEEGSQNRMVKFNVGVAITQTLNNMGLEFLIEAPEDMTVQNDLASISKEERGKLAVSMLATGAYLMTSNKSAFKTTNALNSFLQSEIQNLAGNALKSVDFSVGVDGNMNSAGESQTDYSFQFAKHLWNDRVTFKIGGKVTTGASDTEGGQSFIDNISIEYRLGNNGVKNLRLFYDNNLMDPLEGRYTSAGGGLVWRKRMDSLSELLLFRREKKDKEKGKTEVLDGKNE